MLVFQSGAQCDGLAVRGNGTDGENLILLGAVTGRSDGDFVAGYPAYGVLNRDGCVSHICCLGQVSEYWHRLHPVKIKSTEHT